MCSVAGKTRLTKQEGDGRQENRGPDQLRSRQNLLPTMLPLPKTAFAPPKMLLCFGDPVHPIRLGSYSVSSYCCFVLPATSPREHDTLVFSSFHEKKQKKTMVSFCPFRFTLFQRICIAHICAPYLSHPVPLHVIAFSTVVNILLQVVGSICRSFVTTQRVSHQ